MYDFFLVMCVVFSLGIQCFLHFNTVVDRRCGRNVHFSREYGRKHLLSISSVLFERSAGDTIHERLLFFVSK
jgi:hypothetical protein